MLGSVLLPVPKNAFVRVLLGIGNFATRSPRSPLHGTSGGRPAQRPSRLGRRGRQSPRILSISPTMYVLWLGVVGKRHNDPGGLDSSSASRVPIHGGTSVPSASVFSGNSILHTKVQMSAPFLRDRP